MVDEHNEQSSGQPLSYDVIGRKAGKFMSICSL